MLTLIECPRDAWQGLPGQIPTATKVEYLKALVAAGFKHIDAVSFVSPKAVPQMADSETVLRELDPPDDVEIIAIVVNERGVERAIATEAVRTVGFPYSLSPTFLKNNQNQTPEENLDILEKVKLKADEGGLDTIAYISMAFGNPYDDLWNAEELIEGIGLLADMDLQAISLADTVGLATPQQIADLVGPVLQTFAGLEIGVHLHSRPADAAAKVLGRLRRRLPPLRLRHRRPRRMPLRARRPGRQYSHRKRSGSAAATWGRPPGNQAHWRSRQPFG